MNGQKKNQDSQSISHFLVWGPSCQENWEPHASSTPQPKPTTPPFFF